MQKQEDINSFDLQVRQMLENAQERAPRSAWKAVSARLGEGESRASGFNWAWGAAGLAFAAMLAAGLFFAGTFKTPATSEVSTERIAQVIEQAEVEAEEEVEAEIVEKPEIPVTVYKVRRAPEAGQSAKDSEGVPATAIMSSSEAAAEQIWKEQPWKNRKTDEKAEKAGEENFVDPIAEMEREERMAEMAARNRKRPSIYAGGILSSNKAESSQSWMGVDGSATAGLIRTGNENFGIPASLGLGVKLPLGNSRFAIGTGLNWSVLSSTFDGMYNGAAGDVRHNMHYIGVPVNVYFDLFSTQAVKIYAYAGGEAEYCISSNYAFHSAAGMKNISEQVKGLQYSVGAGLGVEFKITDKLGLYVDPSFRNYFYSGHPSSVRTQQPQLFNFEAGLRFNL